MSINPRPYVPTRPPTWITEESIHLLDSHGHSDGVQAIHAGVVGVTGVGLYLYSQNEVTQASRCLVTLSKKDVRV